MQFNPATERAIQALDVISQDCWDAVLKGGVPYSTVRNQPVWDPSQGRWIPQPVV